MVNSTELTVHVARSQRGDFIYFCSNKNHIFFYHSNMAIRDLIGFRTISLEGGLEFLKNDEGLLTTIEAAQRINFNIELHDQILINSIEPFKMQPGIFYNRIWRGIYDRDALKIFNSINNELLYKEKYNNSKATVSSLYESLDQIFKYIEPAKINLRSFSNKIRELLILICTEVETSFVSILKENGVTRKKNFFSTNDYYMLCDVLHLPKWKVSLKNYPDLGDFSPFSNWDKNRPTQSLPWYDSYNKTKHDREKNFHEATLENLINSAAALNIMQSSQWGPEIYSFSHGNIQSPFKIIEFPSYEINEVYIPNIINDSEFTRANFPGLS